MTLLLDNTAVTVAAEIGAGLAVGLAIGTMYFAALWRVTRDTVEGGSVFRLIGLQMLRLVLTGAALTLVTVYGGALALIAAAGGIVGARELVLRRTGARS